MLYYIKHHTSISMVHSCSPSPSSQRPIWSSSSPGNKTFSIKLCVIRLNFSQQSEFCPNSVQNSGQLQNSGQQLEYSQILLRIPDIVSTLVIFNHKSIIFDIYDNLQISYTIYNIDIDIHRHIDIIDHRLRLISQKYHIIVTYIDNSHIYVHSDKS